MVRFANELKSLHDDIDKKLCKGTGTGSENNQDGRCGADNNKSGLKSALGANGGTGTNTWPSLATENNTPKAPEKISTEMGSLNTDEKAAVASLFTRTVQGGEVVEIKAISSTSVMINACYDVFSEGISIVPYACVGLGGNFIETI